MVDSYNFVYDEGFSLCLCGWCPFSPSEETGVKIDFKAVENGGNFKLRPNDDFKILDMLYNGVNMVVNG